MIAYISLLFAFVGLLLYILAANPKLAEAGRILFFAGVFVFTAGLSGHTVKLF